MDIMSFLLGYESGKEVESGGEGKPWVYASGTFKPTATGHTVEHNLGVVPDMMMMWARVTPTEKSKIIFTTGFSEAVMAQAGNPAIAFLTALLPTQVPNSNPVQYYNTAVTWKNALSMTNPNAASIGYFHNATDTTVEVGGGTCTLDTSVEYEWLAIGGIF